MVESIDDISSAKPTTAKMEYARFMLAGGASPLRAAAAAPAVGGENPVLLVFK
jgi:hypothetical protein